MPIPGDNLTQGWGVMRLAPWRLAGVFTASIDAEKFADSLGPNYLVRFGDHTPGLPNFAFENPNF